MTTWQIAAILAVVVIVALIFVRRKNRKPGM
jgi:LPXTG-motif cell wall-anchored protein